MDKIYEASHEKTNNVVSDQVLYKPESVDGKKAQEKKSRKLSHGKKSQEKSHKNMGTTLVYGARRLDGGPWSQGKGG